MSANKEKKDKKSTKKIKTGLGVIGYEKQKIKNNEGPFTSHIHPTIQVGRRSYEKASGLGSLRAGLINQQNSKSTGDSLFNIKRHMPYRGHFVDNIFGGRFNKKGKDLHSHVFAISHGKGNNHHFQEARIRHHKSNVYQPSITMGEYNNKVINREANNDYDNQIYAVNQQINIDNLAQGPLA